MKKIVDQINPDIWKTYFKFSVVRNPWDMVVSMFYYRRIARNYKDNFDDLVKKMGTERNHNYDIYKINNQYICDFYIKYENLENDLKYVLEKCNIKNYDLKNLKKFNSNYKPVNTDYKKYYNDERKKIIRDLYSDYIEKFNYEF